MEGHLIGYGKILEIMRWCKEEGVLYMTLYAFSTENWNRSKEEVSYLTNIFENNLVPDMERARQENVAVRFAGDLKRFGSDFEKRVQELEVLNPKDPTGTLVVALSYGGRLELVTAINKLLAQGKGSVTEEEFSKELWTCDIPDPDLIIRTGGEQRLSNFLPWQSVYSELFFTPTYWPAFTKEEFIAILDEYASRERRRGK
jgi:undecaprenyl diphosphate synthase